MFSNKNSPPNIIPFKYKTSNTSQTFADTFLTQEDEYYLENFDTSSIACEPGTSVRKSSIEVERNIKLVRCEENPQKIKKKHKFHQYLQDTIQEIKKPYQLTKTSRESDYTECANPQCAKSQKRSKSLFVTKAYACSKS